MQIEELLLEYKPTMVFVEHDSIFVEKIASAEIVI
jgi:lincosamide and streptogramin A transport system ATP-binding/permease protein